MEPKSQRDHTSNPFVHNPTMEALLREIESERLSSRSYSDIVDDEGRQYVDLVQQGGGVLGIALVGYTYIMEKAGIRFFSLAGTSAGAINTVAMAGMSPIGEEVSEKILGILTDLDMFSFVDGGNLIRWLIKRGVSGRAGLFTIAISSLPVYFRIKRKLGLNPGQEFVNWIDDHVRISPEDGSQSDRASTLAELQAHRERIPPLKVRGSGERIDRSPALKIITSDVTTKTKVTLPLMADLYWKNPDKLPLSTLVRASMSIPFFFDPMVVTDIPNAGANEDHLDDKETTRWWKYAGYRGEIPPEVRFVDGGMLSNFPINSLHNEKGDPPRKPTFGVLLSSWRNTWSDTSRLSGFSGAMINTMRQLHDYDFFLRHPEYQKLVCSIDADGVMEKTPDGNEVTKYNWLDFNMSREKQIELFLLGATKAVEFLKGFDWELYKEIRANTYSG